MQVTLINARDTLDISRTLADGSLEIVGSYGITVSDPAFVKRSEDLIAEIEARGLDDVEYDYVELTERCTGLLRMSFESPDEVNEVLGTKPDLFNSMLLLTSVMKIVNKLNPGEQMIKEINQLLPDLSQLSAEMVASQK